MPKRGKVCAVAGCDNSSSANPEFSYHRFPLDKKLRQAWIIKTRRKDKFNPNTSRICSRHFAVEDYQRDMKAELLGTRPKALLNPGAIPSLFLNDLTTVSKCARPRKKQQIAVEQTTPVEGNLSTVSSPRARDVSLDEEPMEIDNLGETVQLQQLVKDIQDLTQEISTRLRKKQRIEEKNYHDKGPLHTDSSPRAEEIFHVEDPTEIDDVGETVEIPYLTETSISDRLGEKQRMEEDVSLVEEPTENDNVGETEEIPDLTQAIRLRYKQRMKEEISLVKEPIQIDHLEEKVQIQLLKKENQDLRKEMNFLKAQLIDAKASEEQHYKVLNTVFSENEINILTQKKKMVHWTRDELKNAFTLCYLSKRAYIYLRETRGFPLPNISTLNRWASRLASEGEVLEDGTY